MKVLVHLTVILVAAALGLAAGMMLRSNRLAQASAAASAPSTRQPAQKSVRANVSVTAVPAREESPVAAKLERDLAQSTGVTRWLCWVEALEKAAPADFPRLIMLAKTDSPALEFVAARWAAIAPRQMFDWVVASSKNGLDRRLQQISQVLFDEWAKRDPEAAIAALNESDRLGMVHAWQMAVATTVIKNDIERGLRLFEQWHIENYMPFNDERGPVPQWAAADPRHAAEFALEHRSGYLSQGVAKAIGEEWAKTDPAAALQFAAANQGELGSLLGTSALRAWAQRDLGEAADWLSRSDELTRNRLSPGFVEAWGKKDASAALTWCEENLAGSSLARAVASVVQGAGVKNVEATAALIGAMKPSAARTEGAVEVARQWFPSLGGMAGPTGAQTVRPETLAWLANLDSVSIKRVMDEETWSWATSDPRSMADFLLRVDSESIGDWSETCLARQMARKNPAEALEWASRLPGNRGLVAGSEAYAEWRSAQPEAAAQWLNALAPDDARREPFFRTTIRLLAHDPQALEQLATMTPQDRAAARSVIETMTGLSEERRTRLLSGLGGR